MVNILFLLTDDQRFDTINALGNSEINTPNLDQLVQNGTSFEEAFIPGGTSGAVCMPSRAMIHTGRFLTELDDCGSDLPEEHTTIGEHLRNNGYETHGIGKWHNGVDSYMRSFTGGDHIFFGGMWDHWNVPVNSYDTLLTEIKMVPFTQDPFSSNQKIEMIAEKVPLGQHSTDFIADEVIRSVESLSKQDKPFFIYGSFLAPHDPRTMPDTYKNMYHPDDISLPENFLPDHPFLFDIHGQRDESLESYPRDEKKIRQHLADYYSMISHLDDRIGDIVDSLEKSGQLDNTLIIFSGDNGLAIGQHGLMGKQNLYDCSTRIPLIMAGPNIPKNQQLSGKVLLMDLLPTILDYLNISHDELPFSRSFLPSINGKDNTRDELYLMFTDKIRGVLTKEYKFLEYRTSEGHYRQLFNRQNDPYEITNLYGQNNYQEITQELITKMNDLAISYGDKEFDFGLTFWNNHYTGD